VKNVNDEGDLDHDEFAFMINSVNSAKNPVIRERYPIPTVEETPQDLNQSKVNSKLDLKWAYQDLA